MDKSNVEAGDLIDTLNKASDLATLLQWIESARLVIDNINYLRRLSPDLAIGNGPLTGIVTPEWGDMESSATQWLISDTLAVMRDAKSFATKALEPRMAKVRAA